MNQTSSFFDAGAPAYDALRPQNGAWWRLFDALVEYGDLRGRRVLDVGCGTGTLAVALAQRASARVWGIEASKAMLAVAQARGASRVGFKHGEAEALPFKAEWFERVVMRLVVHLVDHPRAFAEAARVLSPGGRIVIATFDEGHFDAWWAGRFFPSLPAVDRARFPTRAELSQELADAGFTGVRLVPLPDVETVDRETALERLRGRHISTFALLDPDEVAAGIAAAERELPEFVEVRLEQLIVVGSR